MIHVDHEQLTAQEDRVSSDEVRTLIKRFGEIQAEESQPSVADVAEALHVEPQTVEIMLAEIRRSKDQEELDKRLDTLERENEQIRSMVSHRPTEGETSRSLGGRVAKMIVLGLMTFTLVVLLGFVRVGPGGGGIGPISLLIVAAFAFLIFKIASSLRK